MSTFASGHRRPGGARRGRRRGFFAWAVLLVAGSSVVVPIAIAGPADASGNVDFVGHWTVTAGGFTVLSEDASGSFTATSDYGPSYVIVNGMVSGSSYTFEIDAGSSYVSYNSGTITGNTLSGSFYDTNGTVESYTGYRDSSIPSVTSLSCAALPGSTGTGAAALQSCTTTVTEAVTPPDATPTGSVTFSATSGTLGSPSCPLAGGALGSASCSVTYQPLPPASTGGSVPPPVVTAAYGGDSAFRASSGTATVVTGALAITTTSLPAASGAPYSATLQATGGTPSYVWSISSGSLPAGLSLDASTGVISGTPTATSTANFVVQVADSSSPPATATASLSIDVQALTITPANLPPFVVGDQYSVTLSASGGTGPYTWSQTAGSLPKGLNLDNASGVISGMPSGTASSTFGVQAADNSSPALKGSASLTIAPLEVTSITRTTPPVGTGAPAPAASGSGTGLVLGGDLTLPGGPSSPPTTASPTPAGPAEGGTAITIAGSGFTTATAVSFVLPGGNGTVAATSFTVVSDTEITAVTPAIPEADFSGTSLLVDVVVSAPGPSSAGITSPVVTADQFSFNLPLVTSVVDPIGPISGGNTIKILGTGFENDSAVAFDFTKTPTGDQTTPVLDSGPPLTCPAKIGGNPPGYPPSSLLSTTVPALDVVVVSSSEIDVTVPNVSRQLPVTPAGSSGSGLTLDPLTQYLLGLGTETIVSDVVVSEAAITSKTSCRDHYTFDQVGVTKLSSTIGPAKGGRSLTVTGVGLWDTGSVLFKVKGGPTSGAQVSVLPPFGSMSNISLTVTTPSVLALLAPGQESLTADLLVGTGSGGGATSPANPHDVYTFERAAVTGVSLAPGPSGAGPTGAGHTGAPAASPPLVSAAGGGKVLVTGWGFTGATSVVLVGPGGKHVSVGPGRAGFAVNSDDEITLTTPRVVSLLGSSHAVTFDVVVHVAGVTTPTVLADRLQAVGGPVVASLSPSFAPALGGTKVTVSGSGLSGVTAASFVLASGASVTATAVKASSSGTSLTLVTAKVPSALMPASGPLETHLVVTAAGPLSSPDSGVGSQLSFEPLAVTAISPTHGPATGGTPLVVTGTGVPSSGTVSVSFVPRPASPGAPIASGAKTVVVGHLTATAAAGSPDSTITLRTPPLSAAGATATKAPTYEVEITAGTATSKPVTADRFSLDPVVVSKVSPPSGPMTGTTLVTISGSGFTPGAKVDFVLASPRATVRASNVTVKSSTKITAEVPDVSRYSTALDVKSDVVVTAAAGTSKLQTSDRYDFQRLAVTQLSPVGGPLDGGTTVTVTGTGFSSTSTVTFVPIQPDGTSYGAHLLAPNVAFVSSSELVVTTPSLAAFASPLTGSVTADLLVTVDSATSAPTSADRFTFSPSGISKVVPSSTATPGQNAITVTGWGLSGVVGVSFEPVSGGTPISATAWLPVPGTAAGTELSVYTPEVTGLVAPSDLPLVTDLVVTTGSTTTPTSSADHYVFADIGVTAVSVPDGPVTGGTTIDVSGFGFTPQTSVSFVPTDGAAAIRASSVIFDSANQLTVTSPDATASLAGSQASMLSDVVAKGPDGAAAAGTTATSATTSADRFTFARSGVRSITPASGLVAGGGLFTVTGWGLGAASAVELISGSHVLLATLAGELTPGISFMARAPDASGIAGAGSLAATVRVVVGPVATFSDPHVAYTFGAPGVGGVLPATGPATGGTVVDLSGSYLADATKVEFVVGSKSDVGTGLKHLAGGTLSVTLPNATALVPSGQSSAKATVVVLAGSRSSTSSVTFTITAS